MRLEARASWPAPRGGGWRRGGSGNDTVYGGDGKDMLWGNAGDDQVNGGSDEDFVDAGPDQDTVNSKDGAKDSVLCGTGIDRVAVDVLDTESGCERFG